MSEKAPDDAASSDECVIVPASSDEANEAETDFHPFDEIKEGFKPGPPVATIDADGLARQVIPNNLSDIPVLSKKTLVCMGDFSKFVKRAHWGDVFAEFEPSEVTRMSNGRWAVRHTLYEERAKVRAESRVAKEHWVEVEPIRPPCKHYVRQKVDFPLNQEHKQYVRLCSARRTTEGTFMSVGNTGVYACDMRDPYDAETAAELEKFDEMKVLQGENREQLPIGGSTPSLGIFGSKGA